MVTIELYNSRELGGGGGGGSGERIMRITAGNNGGARGNENGTICRERRHNGAGRPIYIAVAVAGDKTSQGALKWAIENLVTAPTKNVVVKLIHVAQRLPYPNSPTGSNNSLIHLGQASDPIDELLLPFRCFCTRKRVSCEIVVLEDHDVAKALIQYISRHCIENFIVGASSRNVLSKRLFKTSDIPSRLQKWAPDFCNVYTISRGKISAARTACRPVPAIPAESNYIASSSKSYDELSVHDGDMGIDISVIGSGRRSTDSMLYSFYENFGSAAITQIPSVCSMDIATPALESEFGNFDGTGTPQEISSMTPKHNGSRTPFLLEKVLEDMEEEMKELRMELKQTIVMYRAACTEAITAKQKASELEELKMKERQRLEEALLTLEANAAALENEKAKSKAAILTAEIAQRLFEEKEQQRVNADKMKKNKVLNALCQSFIAFKYQSLFNVLVASFLIYMYFSIF